MSENEIKETTELATTTGELSEDELEQAAGGEIILAIVCGVIGSAIVAVVDDIQGLKDGYNAARAQ
ncbi:MAG: hypothetical protein H0X64_08750 [Gemmatimonadaceae bacterium]|nr:hypothetical protein [Gemmatimonadaceae bacterium]